MDWGLGQLWGWTMGGIFVLGIVLIAHYVSARRQGKVISSDLNAGEKWIAEFEAEEDDRDPDNNFLMRPIRLIVTNQRLLVEYPKSRNPLPLLEYPRQKHAVRSTEWIAGLVPVPLSDVLAVEQGMREEPVLLGEKLHVVLVSLKQFGEVKVVSKPDTVIGQVLVATQKSHLERVFFFTEKARADQFFAALKKAVAAVKRQ